MDGHTHRQSPPVTREYGPPAKYSSKASQGRKGYNFIFDFHFPLPFPFSFTYPPPSLLPGFPGPSSSVSPQRLPASPLRRRRRLLRARDKQGRSRLPRPLRTGGMTRKKKGARGRRPRREAGDEWWPRRYADEEWPHLVDMVLSWSLEDVMDEGLFKNKVGCTAAPLVFLGCSSRVGCAVLP